MSQAFRVLAALALWLAPGLYAAAEDARVGLGVALGVTLPEGMDWPDFEVRDWEPSLEGGFFVDVPIAWSFHLRPRIDLYRIGGRYLTDLDLGLQLVFPLWPRAGLELTVGVAPGLTARGASLAGNLQGLAGASVHLFLGVHAFLHAAYGIVFDARHNLQVIHLQGGLMLRL